MACWKCSAELHGAKKFCGHCGAAVAAPGVDPFASTVQPNARPQAPVAPGSAPGSSAASPGSSIGAASVGATSVGAPSVGAPRSRVSPLASSAMEFSSAVREIIVAADAQAAVVAPPAGTVQMQQVPPRPAPVPPAPVAAGVAKPPSVAPPPAGSAAAAGPLGPGTAVRVRWSNGQKYPGTIWQVHGTQVLVAFGDGQRHWVEASFVERA